MPLIISSFLIGFAAAASPGVVQMTVLQNSLNGKIKVSFKLIGGVAVMNFIILILCYFGTSQFIRIPWLYYSIGTIGLGYMLYIGAASLVQSLKNNFENIKIIAGQSFLSGMLLCLLSPLSYIYFIGISTSFKSIGFIFATINSLTVSIGSFIFYSFIVYLGSMINRYSSKRILTIFQFLSSLAIIIFAIKLFIDLFTF